ncbi:MAG: FG-GAP-like repeat-containing protein, partial [bacterium]
ILVGNFAPNDIGDIDKDSLPDLVGRNTEYYYNDYFHTLVSTQESPNSSSYPESLSWYQRYSSNAAEAAPFYYTGDLDQDGNDEINFVAQQSGYTYIFENVGNDSNVIVWSRFQVGACSFAYDDFDLDGRKEFVTANLGSAGITSVYENVAPDSYELIYQDTVRRPNGSDVFSGNDLDGDGKPEFFVSFAQYLGGNYWDYYLYMWETIGNNSYERILVDSYRIHNFTITADSKCGDLDGDGIEELVWSTTTQMRVYKAIGNNQFQLNWVWTNDHSNEVDAAKVNIYDMNNNGYNEIVFSGNGKISIFEVEAVRLLTPNGGQNLLPGDSVLIQWQKFYPPRCDSFSLRYTTDNGSSYNPIGNGISAQESTYNWIVPNTPSESCRVKVIAYGPGTQFDESDALFTILPTGLEETQVIIDQPLRLDINPNPSKAGFRFQIRNAGKRDLNLKIYTLSGELIKTFFLMVNNQQPKTIIWDGKDNKGKLLPSGIYLLKIESDYLESIEKLIITR